MSPNKSPNNNKKKEVYNDKTYFISGHYHYRETNKKNGKNGKIGKIQRFVLEFGLKHLYIQPSQVVVYLKDKNLEVDRRRIHDSIKLLEQRGLLQKKKRGIYVLTEEGRKTALTYTKINESNFRTRRRRKKQQFQDNSDGKNQDKTDGKKNVQFQDSESPLFLGGSLAGSLAGVFPRVVRLHFGTGRWDGGLDGLVLRVEFLFRVLRVVRRWLIGFYGRSRFYGLVRGLVVDVDLDSVFVGGHGLVGGGRSRGLIPLDRFVGLGLKPREVGLDVSVSTSLDSLFFKAYLVDGLPVSPVPRSLTEFMVSGVGVGD